MLRYILGRVGQSLLTLVVISLVVFVLVRLTGNPIDVILPLDASPEMREQATRALGLDRPLYVQYAIYLSDLATGDLGTSIQTRRPVVELLAQRLGNTLELVGAAMFLALALAIPLGVLAALRRGSAWDSLARTVALLGQSVPTFWAGIILIAVFSVHLEWLPAGRREGPEHLILPAVTLGLFGFLLSGVLRLLRGSLLDVLGTEYIKFARLKGLPDWNVNYRHALKNAFVPVLTFIGFYFGIVMSSTVIVETVFAWPGLGRLAYEAVQWRDFPVVQGVVLLVSVLTLASNLVVDILYVYLDPRIRYS